MSEPLARFNTIQHADAVECAESLVALCTYELDELTQTKAGTISLLVVDDGDSDNPSWKLCTTHACAAVFDAKWRIDNDGSRFLMSSTANAGVKLLEASSAESLRLVGACTVAADSVSALSVSWLSRNGDAPAAIVSRSDGEICVVEVGDGSSLRQSRSIVAHALANAPIEVWTVAANPFHSAVVWSGADDAMLKGWDLRTPCNTPTFTAPHVHQSGVCCIAWHPHVEHIVATGSYDEHIRLWDDRVVGHGPVSVPFDTGGGVWRLKWHPHSSQHAALLAACMRGGFQVFDVSVALGSSGGATNLPSNASAGCLRRTALYLAHESEGLAYGVDWMAAGSGLGRVASCSFYDHLLTLWKPEVAAIKVS